MPSTHRLLKLWSSFELTRFRGTNFFPTRPQSLGSLNSICIGTKSRNLGDALALTSLPEKLKKLYPELKIYTYFRSFNPVVHQGNPAVEGAQYLPDQVYGDDCNIDTGQLIQLKEKFFELPISTPPRPRIFLTSAEKVWAARLGFETPKTTERPICVIHPWGHTIDNALDETVWARIVAASSERFRFWQVGIEGHRPIAGCEQIFLLKRAVRCARDLFAVLSRANAFMGVDSGPMHVARAFQVPSLIFLKNAEPAQVFENRKKRPYFLSENYRHACLYEENYHRNVASMKPGQAEQVAGDFLSLPLWLTTKYYENNKKREDRANLFDSAIT